MIISVNWLRKYTPIELPVEDLARLIGERLVEIEEVIDIGARYEGIVVARVKKVYKHPNADKLNVVEIDDGGVAQNIKRLDSGHVQVVCGAPNVREGILVAWIMPGSTVPSSHDDDEPFVLSARELRGVLSNGMLASGKELAINNDHQGIVEVDGDSAPGTSIKEVLELNDYLLDIENKSLTHRPDCFGLIGFAREVAAISGVPFKSPDWLLALEPSLAEKSEVAGINKPKVTINNPELCPRYEAVVIAGVDSTKQSPLVIQSYLKRVGVRPISAVVDVTNYLMVTTGHPLHAFDYDAFLGAQNNGDTPEVIVRSAREGEQLKLLDDRVIDLVEGDILICAGDTPVGLAGAMGGGSTEVTENTKNILLEAATFNLYNLRNTSMRHGVFTDAVTRFTKGQSAEQTAPVLASAVRMLCDVAGGTRVSEIIDVFPDKKETEAIPVSVGQVNQLLGSELSVEQVKKTLINVECDVTPGTDDILLVTPPYWRADLHVPEDLIEEVGRINGFDTISPVLPTRPYAAIMSSEFDIFRSSLRNDLVRMGANEVLTYSFVHGNLMKSAGQNPDDAYRIVNAISPDLQYYRTSLTPSLFDKVYANVRQGYDRFAMFEINKVHLKGIADPSDADLPKEHNRLGFIITANNKAAKELYEGSPYYQAKYYLQSLMQRHNVEYSLRPLAEMSNEQGNLFSELTAPYEPKRSAAVYSSDDVLLGVIGEFKRSVAKSFKLPQWTAGFELALGRIYEQRDTSATYTPLSRFPGTQQDICFRVKSEVPYQQIVDCVLAELKNHSYETSVEPVDVYQRSDDDEYKQVTIRIALTSHRSTITSDQASVVIDAVSRQTGQQLGAERV